MLGILCACLVQISRAEEHTKETVMSINRPLQVRDILLAPGQYVFRLTKPDVDHSVVSIYNAQTHRLERTIIGFARVIGSRPTTSTGLRFPNSRPGGVPSCKPGFTPARISGGVLAAGEEPRTAPQSNPTGNRQILARPVMVRRHAKRVKAQRR